METFMNPLAAIYLVFVIGRFCWVALRAVSGLIIPHRNSFPRTNKTVKKTRHDHKK